jgi:hypothetical protein
MMSVCCIQDHYCVQTYKPAASKHEPYIDNVIVKGISYNLTSRGPKCQHGHENRELETRPLDIEPI